MNYSSGDNNDTDQEGNIIIDWGTNLTLRSGEIYRKLESKLRKKHQSRTK